LAIDRRMGALWPCLGVGHEAGVVGRPICWTSLDPITELKWLGWEVDPADTGEISRVAIKEKI
jgi:hypothetical protein